MEPHIAGIGVYLLTEHTESIALAAPRLPHLFVEKAINGNAQEVEIDNQIVHIYYFFRGVNGE